MKHLTFISLMLLVFLGSCNKNTYTINGESPVDDGSIALLYTTEGDSLSATTTANGQFTFQGKIDTLTMAIIYIRDGETQEPIYRSNCVLEPGTISISIAEVDHLEGTPHNDQYNSYKNSDELNSYNLKLNDLANQYMAAANSGDENDEIATLTDQITDIQEQLRIYEEKYLPNLYNENKDNKMGAFLMNEMIEVNLLTEEQIDSALLEATPVVRNYKPIANYITRMENLKATSAGNHFVDFQGIDFATGETTSLSSLINGKIAVIDFWASWCRPCKQEIQENLIKLYNKYQSKGIVIIGVDVWDKIPAHAEAVEALGITYPQLIDTSATASTLYGFNAIPQIILIGQDGTILGRDLRGPAIEEAILKALE